MKVRLRSLFGCRCVLTRVGYSSDLHNLFVAIIPVPDEIRRIEDEIRKLEEEVREQERKREQIRQMMESPRGEESRHRLRASTTTAVSPTLRGDTFNIIEYLFFFYAYFIIAFVTCTITLAIDLMYCCSQKHQTSSKWYGYLFHPVVTYQVNITLK